MTPDILEPAVLPCADKITYETKDAAIGGAAAVEWQRGLGLRPYKCRYCHLWHLATKQPED